MKDSESFLKLFFVTAQKQKKKIISFCLNVSHLRGPVTIHWGNSSLQRLESSSKKMCYAGLMLAIFI